MVCMPVINISLNSNLAYTEISMACICNNKVCVDSSQFTTKLNFVKFMLSQRDHFVPEH